ncbi:MAG: prephenate dehydratase [Lachnospiraceae bacterium]|nr:prephenate dehydratase [Lachnospiraceae bacterium]
MSLDLNEIRKEIDEIDAGIVDLYEKRMNLCKNVAEFKIQNNKKVLDKAREEEKIKKVSEFAKNDFDKKAIEELFTQIMAISRKMQYQILAENGLGMDMHFEKLDKLEKSGKKVVYQGVPGAYSHQAMINYFGEDVEHFNVATFRDAMEAIKEGKADYGVLPIENSTAGIVNDVYDLLVEYDNYIVDQTDVLVSHALLGTKDSTIDDIKVVYSHPQGLMQCQNFLEEHKDWQQIAQPNTAGSAKKVVEENDKSQAAIASVIAGKIYGLKVLEENINRNNENTTRFIIVGNKKVFEKKASKICISFEISHKSGTLYNILSHFIFNGLNMTKIESRPIKNKTWEYRFFVEFEGLLDEPAVLNALRGVLEEANSVKILGNY